MKQYKNIITAILILILFSPLPLPAKNSVTEIQRLKEHLTRIENNTQLEKNEQNKIISLYQDAITDAQETANWLEKAKNFDNLNKNASKELNELKKFLLKPDLSQKKISIANNTPLAKLEAGLLKAEADLQKAQDSIKSSEEDINKRAAVAVETPKYLEMLRQELAASEDGLHLLSLQQNSDDIDLAQYLRLTTKKELITAKIKALEAEKLFYDSNGELLIARRDKAVLEFTQAEKLSEQYRKIIQEHQQAEALAAVQKAQKAKDDISSLHPMVHKIALKNAELAKERAKIKPEINQALNHLQEILDLVQQIKNDFSNTKEQASAARFSSTFGVLIRTLRSNLPDIHQHKRELKLRQSAISNTQFRAIELQNQRSDMANTETIVHEYTKDIASDNKEKKNIEDELLKLIQQQRDLLFELWDDYSRLLKTLVEMDSSQTLLIEKTQEYIRFIDERILWTQSRRPVSFSDIANIFHTMKWLANKAGWHNTALGLVKVFQHNPFRIITGLIISCLLIWLCYFLKQKFQTNDTKISFHMASSFKDTLKSGVYTLLITAIMPLLIGWIGWELAGNMEISEFLRTLGKSIQQTATIWFFLLLMYNICKTNGLAKNHLQWPQQAVDILRINLFTVMTAGLPMAFIYGITNTLKHDMRKESLGLFAFITGMAITSWFIYKTFNLTTGVFSKLLEKNKQHWLNRWRYLWYPGAVSAPVFLILLSVSGYYYTASQLASNFWDTALTLTGVILMHSFLTRLMIFIRQKITIEQILETQVKSVSDAESKMEKTEDIPEAEIAPVSIPQISQQTSRFLNIILVSIAGIIIWMVWADALPALVMLQHYNLGYDFITLADLGLAVIIILITILGAQNIPGLLEFLILQHLPMDSGARYAVKTLSQYGITIAGTITASGIVGLKWSQVQWIVAAMTVGIGFGLQEVFANFISGLILLFERPIRLGDTVTIGSVTGTVTNIQIRATTIMDWDLKELIVPNKNFVTGDIMNWSLSDNTIRMVIKVGIAYGSDTKKALDILLNTANENKYVLQEPRPKAYFLGFGNSSLDFELRVFVAHIDDFILCKHELHMAIDDAFRKADIVIPFPQQDLHVCSIDSHVISDIYNHKKN